MPEISEAFELASLIRRRQWGRRKLKAAGHGHGRIAGPLREAFRSAAPFSVSQSCSWLSALPLKSKKDRHV